MSPDPIREARKRQDHSQELAAKGWYHSFELPDGTLIDGVNPLSRLRERFWRFPIPADLHGHRVLDIGAWDGWFTFEAERRGAAVTAIDVAQVPHFLELHRKFNSFADYRVFEIYELPEAGLGKFDIVFLLGVLYHLRHPLLALEIVCGLATDVAIVESFVTDGETWRKHAGEIPAMEFYEGYELGNQFDNWSGPTVACLMAMCRSAGFARVELLHSEPHNALVACYRKWEAPPEQPASAPPELAAVANNADQGINFAMRKEQYLTCWFHTEREALAIEDLRLEIDGFGAAAHMVSKRPDEWWTASFPMTRGLSPGWKTVRLRFADSDFGDTLRIAVDMPVKVSHIECQGVRDSQSWKNNEVAVRDVGYLTCWVSGLPENADRNLVRVSLGTERLLVTWVGQPDASGVWQVNATVPDSVAKGDYALQVECAGASAQPLKVCVI
jgi:tRNA (mo5U34)-methyltransferase